MSKGTSAFRVTNASAVILSIIYPHTSEVFENLTLVCGLNEAFLTTEIMSGPKRQLIGQQ